MVKYLLAIDGSEHSERAFHFYKETIHKDGDELILVHAVEYPYIPGSPYVRNDIVKEIFDKAKEEGNEIDLKFKKLCEENKISCVVLTEFSVPGEFIIKKAQETNSTMIILGTRGMGTIRRTVLGSVSDYVLHHAHCPVLIARQ